MSRSAIPFVSRTLLCTLFVSCLFSHYAAAQTTDNSRREYQLHLAGIRPVTATPYLAQAGDEKTSIQPALLSEQGALNRSLYGTLIPLPTIILTIPGLIVGPSLGYFYAGLPGRALTGIGIRAAGFGGMLGAFAICDFGCDSTSGDADLALAVFFASSALVVGSAIYDIAWVKESVRNQNEKRRAAQLGIQPQLEISPCYFPRSGSAGLQVKLAFR